MGRREKFGFLGAFIGAVGAAVLLNGGAYLIETSNGGRPQAQGEGSLACFCSVLFVPLGGLAGYFVGRRLGRSEPPDHRAPPGTE